ncbi:winged helix-turn-helix domain-containing protein [Wenjunlia tyrosinilytica]|uniref:Transcriptional regulator n=1 Tax=Wenjunlia tyrosinilytica TaxID=1544741 RepID=A0A918DYL9_9ACTN|nr:winged helix-turn-helix domain-containing protein [Wenjunlia tyrosinilytica]GGO89143.1 transcriptional regulator [Wenjunlia tyrosinilytica]
MAFRIHFTAEDLARTRVASSPWPLWELVIAIRELQVRGNPTRLGAWRRQVLPELPAGARTLFELVKPLGVSPAFLSPTRVGTVEELLDQVRSTPRHEIRRALDDLALHQPVPRWAPRLLDDPRALTDLADTLGAVHEKALAPYWPELSDAVRADRAVRGRELLDGGVERLLAGLFPGRVRWLAPVLELDMCSGLDGDLHLCGRGLVLAPSALVYAGFLIEADADPPVLAFPARHGPRLPLGVRASEGAPPSLGTLLGRTRAAVLHAVADRPGCTTTELAASAGIALASASEHASVLRDAGLITTQRHRNTALHTPTHRGMALLDAT